jgi:putative SOS response-associated peptidase YedK
MRGRSTYKLTWEEIVELYRLTLEQPARNTQARYLPDHTIDTVVESDGKRQLVPMRWGFGAVVVVVPLLGVKKTSTVARRPPWVLTKEGGYERRQDEG